MTPLEKVVAALRSLGRDPRQAGDEFKARCPVPGHGQGHGDRSPSLSIAEGDGGRALINCHACCSVEAVVAAIGLTMADLMPAKATGLVIKESYPYVDANGEVLFEVVRLEPKSFRQRRPNGKGGWTWKVQGIQRVIYRLPAVMAAVASGQPIYIVEGEKDVHAAEQAGVVATTNPGGAGKWRSEFNEAFRAADVFIVADLDATGIRHARKVAASLTGIAGTIRLLQPAAGKDLTDHLAAGKSLDELLPLADDTAPSESTGKPRPLTDTGNAERLHSYAGLDVRYCHTWRKWLAWDGTRWRHDDLGRLMGISKVVVRRIVKEADACPDSALAKRLMTWASKSESRGKRGAMVDLLTSEPGIPIMPDSLDREPWLLNCENGTLDLRTGDLRAHDRADLITKLLPVAFDAAATCPQWERFLERILPVEGVRSFVQRMAGWSLTGDVTSQVLLFCYGNGANGKSTFLRVLLALFGKDYGIQAAPELLLDKQQRGHPTELADLFGVRLAVSVEMGPGRKLDEVQVKQLTGGDLVRARRMREDFWEFEPTHHLWIAANHKPVIHGTDEAMWRRLMLIPFTVTIPEEERDRELLTKLRAELPGILAWAIRGCQQWREIGLAAPDEVRAATKAYRADMDVIGDFIDGACIVAANASVPAKALYDAFQAWAESNGEEAFTQQDFGQRMGERGFQRHKRRGRKVYTGLTLRSDGGSGGPGGPGGPLSVSTTVSPPGHITPSHSAVVSGNSGSPGGSSKWSPSSPRPDGRPLEHVDPRSSAEDELDRAMRTADASAIAVAREKLVRAAGSEDAAAMEAYLKQEIAEGAS